MNIAYEDLERRLFIDGRTAELGLLDLGVELGQEKRADSDSNEIERLEDELNDERQEREDAQRDAAVARETVLALHRALLDRKALWRLLRNADKVANLIRQLKEWPGSYMDMRALRAELDAILDGTQVNRG